MEKTRKSLAVGGAGIAAAAVLGLTGSGLASAAGEATAASVRAAATGSATSVATAEKTGDAGAERGGPRDAGGTLTADAASKAVWDTVAGFGPLQQYFDDPAVEEIWVISS